MKPTAERVLDRCCGSGAPALAAAEAGGPRRALPGIDRAQGVLEGCADPLPVRGDRVVLRRLDVSDLEAFQAYRGDAELGRYQGWAPLPDDAARAFLAEMRAVPLFRPGEWAQVGIADPATGVLIGDIGLHLAEDALAAEIGFTLARAAQGRGLATTAVRAALHLLFGATRVERVVGVTDARNRASIGVLERVGMRRAETRATVFRGEVCVELVYAVGRVGAPSPDA